MISMANMTRTVTCPDGIERVGKFTNRDGSRFSVRVGGKWVAGKVDMDQFVPSPTAKNGNPFRWLSMAE